MKWLLEQIGRWLIKRYDEQSVYCFCPGCGLELTNSYSWHTDADYVRYQCIKCGSESAWLFDVPVPILVDKKLKLL